MNRDAVAREAALRALRAAGFAATGASDVHSARVAVSLDGARLVLVDRAAGGASALDLLEELRRTGGGNRAVQAFTALLAVDGAAPAAASARSPGVARPASGIGYPPGQPPQPAPAVSEAPAAATEPASPLFSELSLRDARSRFEHLYLDDLLRSCRGNVSEVARRAGLARTFLHAKLAKLDLDPTTYRRRRRKR